VAARTVDNTPPTVTLVDPGSVLHGTVGLTSTTSDGTVKVQYRIAGASTWTDVCAAATCTWNTAALPDGVYDLRAVATDNAGLATTSAVVSARRVDNTAPTVSLTDPGSPLQGTVSLSGSATDAGSGLGAVKLQYAPTGTSTWTDVCAAA